MSEEYKKLITERIRDEINRWIDELKGKHPELLLTKQWRILFPKGFLAGHNSIPVVTHSKEGQHLVAEIQFVLPDDLNLDIEDIQLVLKDEGYKDTTFQKIAERCGITRTILYLYFSNKKEIFSASIKRLKH